MAMNIRIRMIITTTKGKEQEVAARRITVTREKVNITRMKVKRPIKTKARNRIKNTNLTRKMEEIDRKQLEQMLDVKRRKLLMLLSVLKLPNSNNSFSSSTVKRHLEQQQQAETDKRSHLKIFLLFSKIPNEVTVLNENRFSNQRTYCLL